VMSFGRFASSNLAGIDRSGQIGTHMPFQQFAKPVQRHAASAPQNSR
jgi:hypothetical protein